MGIALNKQQHITGKRALCARFFVFDNIKSINEFKGGTITAF